MTIQEVKAQRQFDAVLAKNYIARELRNARIYQEEPNLGYIESQLAIIEEYTGEMNQPAISDILEDETGLI